MGGTFSRKDQLRVIPHLVEQRTGRQTVIDHHVRRPQHLERLPGDQIFIPRACAHQIDDALVDLPGDGPAQSGRHLHPGIRRRVFCRHAGFCSRCRCIFGVFG